MSKTAAGNGQKLLVFFGVLILFILVLRILAVFFTTLNLGPDEAQYWRWSKSFEWGYYSKPPMLSWLIGISTGVFGDQEWAVRFFPPFFHFGAAMFVFAAARHLADNMAAVFASLLYFLMPAVSLSSGIMSTDVGLLFFWSAALYCFIRLRDGGGWVSAIGLGLALGAGFLSKYAMIYFLIGLAISILIDQKSRKALLSLKAVTAFALFGLIMAPHLLWNASNGFQTVSHTADNANWGASLLNPDMGIKFIIDQFGVFGPITMAVLVGVLMLMLARRKEIDWTDRKLLVLSGFILPPLLIIIVQAFISRAHANWAASAYPAAAILVGIWVSQSNGVLRKLVYAGLALNLFAGALYSVLIMLPLQTQIDLGASNATKRLRGWPETVSAVNDKVAELDASAIILDEREIWHGLDYYGRDGVIEVPLRAWRRGTYPKSASELEPISAADSENALVLSVRKKDRAKMSADFEHFEDIGELVIDLGGGKVRRMQMFIAIGFNPVEERN